MFWALDDRTCLLLVLAALYVIEGIAWLPRGSVLFVRHPLSRFSRIKTGSLFPSERGGFCFVGAIPGSYALLAQLWPVSLSPVGAFAFSASTTDDEHLPQQTRAFFRWDEIQSVGGESNKVSVNGECFANVCSDNLATIIRDDLRRIAASKDDERAEMIYALVRRNTSLPTVRQRIAHLDRSTRLPMRLSVSMWLTAFVAAPLILWLSPPNFYSLVARWGVLLTFVLLWTITIVTSRRSIRQLCDGATSVREIKCPMWHLFISPACAMWLSDRMVRDFLADLHPLSIAAVVCSPEQFREFAGRIVRDIRLPLLPNCSECSEEARRTETWFREQLRVELDQVLAAAGVFAQEFLAPPKQDGGANSYCPRCEMQYVFKQGSCHVCGGIPLVPFTQTDSSRFQGDLAPDS